MPSFQQLHTSSETLFLPFEVRGRCEFAEGHFQSGHRIVVSHLPRFSTLPGSVLSREGMGVCSWGWGQSMCFWETLSPTQTEKQGVADTWRPPAPTPEQASLLLTLGTSRRVWGPRRRDQCLGHLLLIRSPAPRLVSGRNSSSSRLCGWQAQRAACTWSCRPQLRGNCTQWSSGCRRSVGEGWGVNFCHPQCWREGLPQGAHLGAGAGCLLGL